MGYLFLFLRSCTCFQGNILLDEKHIYVFYFVDFLSDGHCKINDCICGLIYDFDLIVNCDKLISDQKTSNSPLLVLASCDSKYLYLILSSCTCTCTPSTVLVLEPEGLVLVLVLNLEFLYLHLHPKYLYLYLNLRDLYLYLYLNLMDLYLYLNLRNLYLYLYLNLMDLYLYCTRTRGTCTCTFTCT